MISGTIRGSLALSCCELPVTMRFELFGAHTPAVTKRSLSAVTMAVLLPGPCGMQSAGVTTWQVGGAVAGGARPPGLQGMGRAGRGEWWVLCGVVRPLHVAGAGVVGQWTVFPVLAAHAAGDSDLVWFGIRVGGTNRRSTRLNSSKIT